MNFEWSAQDLSLRQEVRAFLDEALPEELLASLHEGEAIVEEVWDDNVRAFDRAMVERGWQVPDLPVEFGGKQLSPMQKYILISEIDYANAPRFMRATVVSLVPALAKLGTQQNMEQYLQSMVTGEITLSIGYSEPEAGTDLANLRTRATRDGDDWVINGMKCWNSRGHLASHCWLLARTGAPDGRHKGLSVFIVPLDAEGVTIQRVDSWGDHAFNDVFFDNVRVPANALIGAEGDGWTIVMTAVHGERSFLGLAPSLRRTFDELIHHCKHTHHDGGLLIDRPDIRSGLVELEVELEMADMMGLDIASRAEAGAPPEAEALGLKVFTSELRTRLADFAMRSLGLPALLDHHDPVAPMAGGVEILYRRAPINRIGVGANEVMRDVIAQRGLGMPRSR